MPAGARTYVWSCSAHVLTVMSLRRRPRAERSLHERGQESGALAEVRELG